MALPVHQQAKYWGIAAAVFLAVLWVLGDVILPFVVGGAIAYFLDPLADRLQRAGLGRVWATSLIALLVTLVFVLMVLAVLPTLARQLAALIDSAPQIFRQLQDFMSTRFPQVMDETSTVRQTLLQIGEAIRARGGELANAVLGSAIGVVNAVVYLVVIPVVSFYMLLDWDRMVARIDALLPREHAPVIRRLARESDAALSAFVRGQMLVCLILGTFYAVALALAGLQFGLIVGAIAGAITFIPYIGALVGGVLAVGLALFQFWGDWLHIAVIGGIFALGQFLEGNIVTPKLVGGSVGVHPVWLLFALAAFGALFGFLGLLVAVPVAAVIAVLARFGIEKYRESQLYRGTAPPEDGAAP